MPGKYFWPCLFLILFCSSWTPVQARKRSLYRYTAKEGLAGDNVYCITQDKDGFLWIATETGVSRFDGATFKNFTVKDGLPGNEINNLYVDRKGRIWMAPFPQGVCYFYKGRIHNSSNDSLVRNISTQSESRGMAEDAQGNLLFATHLYVTYVDKNDHCTRYPRSYSGPGFFEPVPGFTTSSLPLNFFTPRFRQYKVRPYDEDLFPPLFDWSDSVKAAIVPDGSGKRQITFFRNGQPPQLAKAPSNVLSCLPLIPPVALVTTPAGCSIRDLETGKVTDTLLSDMAVNCCFIDADSGIWLGTGGAGLFYFPRTAGWPVGDKRLQVFNFYKDSNDLWIGTSNWQFWKLNEGRTAVERKMTDKELDPRLLFLPEGNIHRLPYYGMLKVLMDQKGILRSFPNYKSLTNVKDTFVMATLHGCLYRLLMPDRMLDSVNVGQRLTCAYYLNGSYYTGTPKGLFIVPGDHPVYLISDKVPLIKGAITSIAYSYENGLVWATSSDNGVYCLKNDKVVLHFNETNGLSSPICKSLFTDGTKAYVGTIEGLNIIDPENAFRIDQYNVADGLPSNSINCVFAEDKQVWVGTSEGLAALDLNRERRKAFFRLLLTEVMVSERRLPTEDGNISLASADNNIRFSYSGISFASMGNVQYNYRLNGLSDIWRQTNEQSLTYPSLAPGSYVLEVFATDRFSVRSNMIRFAFTIQKKWWHYGWVQFGGVVLLLALCISIFWWRARRLQRRQREKLELKSRIIELEQMALRAQMNPHFIFNSLNSFYQYVMDRDLAGASKFIQEFSSLLRILFETSVLPSITLDKELEFLTTYLELERTKHSDAFTYILKVPPDIPAEEIVIPSFVIQPFIENSIRHGIQNRNDKEGRIELMFDIIDDCLTATLTDNGVGRLYTKALKERTIRIHNSKGIALTEERIDLYNKSNQSAVRFEIIDRYENGVATGTIVQFHFPLNPGI